MSGTSGTSVPVSNTDGRRLRIANNTNDLSSATVSTGGIRRLTTNQQSPTHVTSSQTPTTQHTPFSTQQTNQDNIFTTPERPVFNTTTYTQAHQLTTISDKTPEVITTSDQASHVKTTSDQALQITTTSVETTQVTTASNKAATTSTLAFDESSTTNDVHPILTTSNLAHQASTTSNTDPHASTTSNVEHQPSTTSNLAHPASITSKIEHQASTTSNVEHQASTTSNVEHQASTTTNAATVASTAFNNTPLVSTKPNPEQQESITSNQAPPITSTPDRLTFSAASSSPAVYLTSEHRITTSTTKIVASETTLTEPSPYDTTNTLTNSKQTSTEPTRPPPKQITLNRRVSVLNLNFSLPVTIHKTATVATGVTTSHFKNNLTDIVTANNRKQQKSTTATRSTHKRTTQSLFDRTSSSGINTTAQVAIWRTTVAPADRRMSVLPSGGIDGTTVPAAIVGTAGAFVVCSLLFTLASWIHRWRHSSEYESDYTNPIQAYQRRFSQVTITRETNLNTRRTSVGDLVSEGERVSAHVDRSYAIGDHDNACTITLPRYVMGYRFIKAPNVGRRHSTALFEDLHGMELVAIPVNHSLPDLSMNSAVFRNVENGVGTTKPAGLFYRGTREYERNPRERRASGPPVPTRLERRASGPPVLLTRVQDVSGPPQPPPRERRFIPRQSNGRRLPRYGLGSQRWDHSTDMSQWQRVPLDTCSLEGFSVC